jgi:hypothetical protein
MNFHAPGPCQGERRLFLSTRPSLSRGRRYIYISSRRISVIFRLELSISVSNRKVSLLRGMADHSQAGDDSATAGAVEPVKRSRRHRAIVDDPMQLAVMFASMVTTPASENEWIARNGDESLFKVLQKMMPEVRHKSQECHQHLQHDSRVE